MKEVCKDRNKAELRVSINIKTFFFKLTWEKTFSVKGCINPKSWTLITEINADVSEEIKPEYTKSWKDRQYSI